MGNRTLQMGSARRHVRVAIDVMLVRVDHVRLGWVDMNVARTRMGIGGRKVRRARWGVSNTRWIVRDTRRLVSGGWRFVNGGWRNVSSGWRNVSGTRWIMGYARRGMRYTGLNMSNTRLCMCSARFRMNYAWRRVGPARIGMVCRSRCMEKRIRQVGQSTQEVKGGFIRV